MSKKSEISNPYTDWQQVMDLIPDKGSLSVVELGCGEGTRYLVSEFKKVISIELSRYYFDFKLSAANHTFVELKAKSDTAEKDDVIIQSLGKSRPQFVEEIEMLMAEIRKHEAELIFVDFGFHFRGEVVQRLIDDGRHRYIAFHDTNFPYYGYEKLNLIGYAVKISGLKGQGTVILEKASASRVLLDKFIQRTKLNRLSRIGRRW